MPLQDYIDLEEGQSRGNSGQLRGQEVIEHGSPYEILYRESNVESNSWPDGVIDVKVKASVWSSISDDFIRTY